MKTTSLHQHHYCPLILMGAFLPSIFQFIYLLGYRFVAVCLYMCVLSVLRAETQDDIRQNQSVKGSAGSRQLKKKQVMLNPTTIKLFFFNLEQYP